MATTGDVHVGDIGTLYKARLQDQGVDFNPTTATLKRLWFKTPDGLFSRNAQVVNEGGAWYLTYTVTSADAAELHVTKGKYYWQGYVEFAAGERYHTNIESYTVEKNLD